MFTFVLSFICLFTVHHKPKMSRKTATSFLAVTPLFDVNTHSAKHLRQFKYTSLSLIASLLDSEDFVNKVSMELRKRNPNMDHLRSLDDAKPTTTL